MNPGRVHTYCGGANPIAELADASKKQFELDFQIKRITTVSNNLREDFKQTDKKLN